MIGIDPRLPLPEFNQSYLTRLNSRLYELFRSFANEINRYSYEAASAPTTGLWKQGDFVRNTGVTELGTASSKYVILGWVCTVSGEPGTWLECRCLTGN